MQPDQTIRFEAYRLDPVDERLWHAERAVPVTHKAFAVLRVLLCRPGQLVTKEELFREVWPRAVVTDSALTRCIRELRIALKDVAATPRYIETVHRRGFRFIAPVASHQTTILAYANPESHFVGREPELQKLRLAFHAARAGKRQVVFVSGEPGIGKTAMVQAFLGESTAGTDVRVADGRCIEQYGTGEAYLPVLEALERFARLCDPCELKEVLQIYAPAWLAQLPSLWEPDERPPLPPQVPGATRPRMLREITQALEALAKKRPVILWLEDLQWSDYSTLDVLSSLALRREPAKLLVIGTYRPADLFAREHPLRHVTQDLQLRGQCLDLTLGFLGKAAVGEYLARRLGGDRAHHAVLAAAIHARTDGNPLFMVAMLDHLVRQGALQETEGVWTLRRQIDEWSAETPEDLRQLTERQLGQLSPEEQKLLAVASVAGAEFPAAAVAAGMGADLETVEDLCTRLSRHRQFLQIRGIAEWPDGTVTGRYGFLHALYQEVLYGRIPASSRSEMHRRIAQCQEQAYGGQRAAIAAELAMHFERGRDFPRTVHYLQQAGKNALGRSAYAEAIQLLARAVELLKFLPDTGERTQLELELQMALSVPLLMTRGYAAAEVGKVYARAQMLSAQVGEAPRLFPVLRGLWTFYLVKAELGTAQDLAKRLLAIAQSMQDSALLLEAHLAAGTTLLWLGDPAGGRLHAEQAIALYDHEQHRSHAAHYGHDPAVICLSYLGRALWVLGYPDQALARTEDALAQAAKGAHPHSQASALTFAAWVHQFRGEPELVQVRAEAAIKLSAEHGFTLFLAVATVLRGWAVSMLGQPEEGIAQMKEGLTAVQKTGARLSQAYLSALLAETLCHITDRRQEALGVLAEALALVESTGERWWEAELHRLIGEALGQGPSALGKETVIASEAETHLRRAINVAQLQGAKSLELRAATRLAALWRRQGRTEAAAQMLAGIHSWFSEGCSTADFKRASTVLAGQFHVELVEKPKTD
jgi:predicted ATPase